MDYTFEPVNFDEYNDRFMNSERKIIYKTFNNKKFNNKKFNYELQTIFLKPSYSEIRILKGKPYVYYIRTGFYKKLNMEDDKYLKRIGITEFHKKLIGNFIENPVCYY